MEPLTWGMDWVWGVPMIVITVVIHVVGLGFLNEHIGQLLMRTKAGIRSVRYFAMVMGTIVLAATVLHSIEAIAWALAYRLLQATPDNRSAMLYSLNALTSFGHDDLHLGSRWHLLGALEALNGIMLFGLTTAFLFAVMQRVWPERRR